MPPTTLTTLPIEILQQILGGRLFGPGSSHCEDINSVAQSIDTLITTCKLTRQVMLSVLRRTEVAFAKRTAEAESRLAEPDADDKDWRYVRSWMSHVATIYAEWEAGRIELEISHWNLDLMPDVLEMMRKWIVNLERVSRGDSLVPSETDLTYQSSF
jgi:hypothetical protein